MSNVCILLRQATPLTLCLSSLYYIHLLLKVRIIFEDLVRVAFQRLYGHPLVRLDVLYQRLCRQTLSAPSRKKRAGLSTSGSIVQLWSNIPKHDRPHLQSIKVRLERVHDVYLLCRVSNRKPGVAVKPVAHRCEALVFVERIPAEAHGHGVDAHVVFRQSRVGIRAVDLRISVVDTGLTDGADGLYGIVGEICYRAMNLLDS